MPTDTSGDGCFAELVCGYDTVLKQVESLDTAAHAHVAAKRFTAAEVAVQIFTELHPDAESLRVALLAKLIAIHDGDGAVRAAIRTGQLEATPGLRRLLAEDAT
jgi:hypothetical protein